MDSTHKDQKLSAEQIIMLDDEQLDKDIHTIDRTAYVENPENLTEEPIQRLRACTSQPKPHPIDLQQQPKASNFKECHVGSVHSDSTVTMTEEIIHQLRMQQQSEAYHRLVESGGRPSHPIERMEHIVEEPGELTEILSFWQHEAHTRTWEVYEPQWTRWRNFLRVQQYARQGRVKEERHYFLAARYESWDKFAQVYPKIVTGDQGFPEYIQFVKERLSRNGFMRSFELDQDIAKQDKLTTWIEFLSWEYMHYNYYTQQAMRGQYRHGKAWKKLQDSGVLEPGETEAIIVTLEYRLQLSDEEEKAERAVKRAKSDVTKTKNNVERVERLLGSRYGPEAYQRVMQNLKEAEEDLQLAEEAFGRLRHRNGCINRFVKATESYRRFSDKTENHWKLIRWMLQQVPLIEQELGLSDTSSHPKGATNDAEAAVEDSSEALCRDAPAHTTCSGRKGHESKRDEDQPPSKKTKREVDNCERLMKPP